MGLLPSYIYTHTLVFLNTWVSIAIVFADLYKVRTECQKQCKTKPDESMKLINLNIYCIL